MRSHRWFLWYAASQVATALFLIPDWAVGAAEARPNVLIILADDMGFSDAGCYDLAKDRCEKSDLAAQRPDLVRQMDAKWNALETEFRRCARP
jgi:hypothetical protein